MDVLVINCGSSSLKYQLIDSDSERALASGICERIGIDGRFTFKPSNGEKYTIDFNDVIYKYIGELYHQELDVVKKRIKANFAEVLKSKR